jgi:hypothetical protein
MKALNLLSVYHSDGQIGSPPVLTVVIRRDHALGVGGGSAIWHIPGLPGLCRSGVFHFWQGQSLEGLSDEPRLTAWLWVILSRDGHMRRRCEMLSGMINSSGRTVDDPYMLFEVHGEGTV